MKKLEQFHAKHGLPTFVDKDNYDPEQYAKLNDDELDKIDGYHNMQDHKVSFICKANLK